MDVHPGTLIHWKRRPKRRKWRALAALTLFAGATLYFMLGGDDGESEEAEAPDLDPVLTADAPSADPTASPSVPPATELVLAAASPDGTAAPVVAPAQAAMEGPVRPENLANVISGTVEHSLYKSFARHFDAADPAAQLLAEQLAAHFKRIFFFDIDFERDVHPGDRYAFIWERTPESSDGLRLLAARYEGSIDGRVLEGFWFKDPAGAFGRHYDSEGQEAQRSMVNAPIEGYEQISSLLNDRRPRHHGIDFKTPVGTPVKLPFDAVVTEVHRSISRFNGRFLKLRYVKSGLEVIFLHLDGIAPEVAVGKRLKAGTTIAASGNTGHSTAPHLHYQLQRGKNQILDPFKVHGETRRKLSEAMLPEFQRIVDAFRAQMTTAAGETALTRP
ncbi:MAG: M23 family metallopeptidase [Myxococcales bacterium]|nr:MAG: M23 family metallopeptidase [Myxococcales bacterium]